VSARRCTSAFDLVVVNESNYSVLQKLYIAPAKTKNWSDDKLQKPDPTYQFAKNYAAAIERDSAGRIKTEVYGSSQLGSIPRQIEGTQFGATSNVRSFHRTSLSGWTSASR
jgi:TRAP-type C4-dicarboxylate transport system substrate-binding protein